MTQRERHVEKIAQVERDLQTAGPIHAKDLRRELNHLRKELREYDRYMKAAKKGS